MLLYIYINPKDDDLKITSKRPLKFFKLPLTHTNMQGYVFFCVMSLFEFKFSPLLTNYR